MSDLFREGLNTSSLKDEEIGRLGPRSSGWPRSGPSRSRSRSSCRPSTPELRDVVVGEAIEASASPEAPDRTILLVSAHAATALAAADRERIEAWLSRRPEKPAGARN